MSDRVNLNTKLCMYCKYLYKGKTKKECRRFPPKIFDNEFSVFPTVFLTEWCGEFIAK